MLKASISGGGMVSQEAVNSFHRWRGWGRAIGRSHVAIVAREAVYPRFAAIGCFGPAALGLKVVPEEITTPVGLSSLCLGVAQALPTS